MSLGFRQVLISLLQKVPPRTDRDVTEVGVLVYISEVKLELVAVLGKDLGVQLQRVGVTERPGTQQEGGQRVLRCVDTPLQLPQPVGSKRQI